LVEHQLARKINYKNMKCQNCNAPVLFADDRCGKCGAKLLHRRIFPETPNPADFTLTSEDESMEFEKPDQEEDTWQFPLKTDFEAMRSSNEPEPASSVAVRWGGFFRRAGAFGLDVLMILLLCAIMAVMVYIGYKVGLAAHDRFISWDNATPLMAFLTFGGVLIATCYFVVFHGMDGKTVGKWLLGLRVVGEEQRSISYRQALVRWIGTVGLGCASLGLGFLWVLWSREKRGWHDLLAHTWVIRD
jgi:uncharacterized RDD family membrane protein YckC/ribosomal protein S27AE